MTAPRAFHLENERQILRALGRAGDQLDTLPAAHRQIAGVAARAVRAAAPARTGRLRSSIRDTVTGGHAQVTSTLVYAPVIDSGWPAHGIAAQHYAQAGLDAATDRIVTATETAARDVCRTAERVTA